MGHARRMMLAGASIGLAVLALSAPPARADREFSPRFAQNGSGDIRLAANTILTCRAEVSGCSDAQASARGAQLGNNSWNMSYVDVDGDPATFDSSRADLALPPDATVLFAGLYWGANTVAGTRGRAAPDAGARGRVLLDAPGAASYAAVSADRIDEGEARSQRGAYQAFADVTALVAGGGIYTVANLQSATGDDRYGGWALVVAYSSPGEPPRNLTVFDGFVSVNAGDAPRELSVIGFRAPRSGPVRSRVGFVAYEGDLSAGGDGATLNSGRLSDGKQTPTTPNFFNSTIWELGQPFTAKSPDYENQLGYDADIVDATGKIGTGATSAAIRLQTTGETYLPGVAFIVTDLFAPDIQSTKSVSDLNGGLVEPGDELEYVIAGANRGQDDAVNTVVTDPLPTNTTPVPGSLQAAEFQPGAGQVVFRVGSGATAAAGGRLAPGEGYEVRYRVRVAPDTPSGTVIANQAGVSFLAETLGFPVDRTTNDVRLTTAAPDLAMNKSFGVVAPGTYGFTVTNVGDAPSRGPVVVTDTPPAGVVTVVDAGGFGCTGGSTLRCERSDSLAPGQSWVITATISVALSSNTALVEGGGDVNRSNNADTIFLPQPSLAVEKQVTPDTVAPGEQVTYTLTVANRSSATAAGSVLLTDPLPAGLALESVEALDQGTCDATVSCALGTLAAGGSARVRIQARVGAQTGPGEVANSATVSGPLDDSLQSDNADTAAFRIRRTARLELSKRLDGTPTAGRPVRWTAIVENAGRTTCSVAISRTSCRR